MAHHIEYEVSNGMLETIAFAAFIMVQETSSQQKAFHTPFVNFTCKFINTITIFLKITYLLFLPTLNTILTAAAFFPNISQRKNLTLY
jgi:hypothetical protein